MRRTKPVKKQRYKYTIINRVTGLGVREPFSRIIYAVDDAEAKEMVRYIRKCFGTATKIVKLVKLVKK